MPSGKFVLRLDPKIHKALKEEAKIRGESLNSLCNRKLQNTKISEKPDRLSEFISQSIREFRPLSIILFGSQARGEATEKSDTDLLIVLPEAVPIHRELYLRWDKIFKDIHGNVSPQFVHFPKIHEAIGSIWLETALDGEVLYEEGKNMKEILIKIRSQIAEGRYLRKISHGHPYWVRQEILNAK